MKPAPINYFFDDHLRFNIEHGEEVGEECKEISGN